jgi:hypothetical protein
VLVCKSTIGDGIVGVWLIEIDGGVGSLWTQATSDSSKIKKTPHAETDRGSIRIIN